MEIVVSMNLLPELILNSAMRAPDEVALVYQNTRRTYAGLADDVAAASNAFLRLGLQRGERVAVYLEKRIEHVVACFGASAAGGAFVPVNPLLKAEQVAYILRDCNVRILVTSTQRLQALTQALA
jgi:acyl-CoA synthetase (AMP-forming)/AMP-acid ligase II